MSEEQQETETQEPVERVQYRRAKATDAVAIFNLLCRMHADSPVELDPIDDAKSLLVIVQAIRDGLCFVAIDGKKLVGSVGVVQDSAWYSSLVKPMDSWWHALPAYPSVGAALLRLIAQEIPEGPLQVATIAAGADADDRIAPLVWRVARLKRAGSIYVRGS